jgi:hypothetical protein
MRAILTTDIDTAARAAAAVPEPERAALVARLLDRAHAGDKWRKATGRVHPAFGPGTLAGAAAGLPLAAPPRRFDPAACDALAAVIAGIARWRAERMRRAPFKLARPTHLV